MLILHALVQYSNKSVAVPVLSYYNKFTCPVGSCFNYAKPLNMQISANGHYCSDGERQECRAVIFHSNYFP